MMKCADECDDGAAAPAPVDGDAVSESSDDEAPDPTTEASHNGEQIPLFVLDFYIELPSFLYSCLVSRHLPLEDNILVRFSSHDSKCITNGQTMENSIEHWVLPICNSGHFKRIVWLKNSWCTQIDVGTYNLTVGEKDNLTKVSCPLDFFISEGKCCATPDWIDARSVEFQVHNADTDELDPLQFLSSADAPNFVLDIDLDFFSTSNPLLAIYDKANCYAQLIEIFRYESKPTDFIANIVRRNEQLEALRSIFDHLEKKRDFHHLEKPNPMHCDSKTMSRIHKLAKTLAQHYRDEDIDWDVIFEAGCATHNGELPNHKSTPEQLIEYFGFFERFLQRLPARPVAITIAASASLEGYPADQVAYIQKKVLRMLRKKFDHLDRTNLYAIDFL